MSISDFHVCSDVIRSCTEPRTDVMLKLPYQPKTQVQNNLTTLTVSAGTLCS